MKNISLFGILLIAMTGFQSCNKISHKSIKADNSDDSASYMIGISVGHNLKSMKMPAINSDLIAKGIDEVLKNDSAMSAQEASIYLNKYFTALHEKIGQENLEKGKKFFDENRKVAGVTETVSGLQIKTIQEGTGKSPNDSSVVKCNYRGRLLNGDVFDSSYDRGQPAEFSLKGVIKGWREGLQLMKEGGKYELYVPSDLAYGPRGGGQMIGPNEALIFEIELLEVLPPEPRKLMNKPGMKGMQNQNRMSNPNRRMPNQNRRPVN
jgi:FKBP-type peptidyl-prolyl cis-trans isomerase FklB